LRSTIDPSFSLTASNAASDRYGLGVALAWWAVGIVLVTVYFTYLYRSMRGKGGAEPGAAYGPPPLGADSPPGARPERSPLRREPCIPATGVQRMHTLRKAFAGPLDTI